MCSKNYFLLKLKKSMKILLNSWFAFAFFGALITGIWYSQKLEDNKAQLSHLFNWLIFPLYFIIYVLSTVFTFKVNNRISTLFYQYMDKIIFCKYGKTHSKLIKYKETTFEQQQPYSFFINHKNELMIVNRQLVRLIDVVADVDDITMVEKYIFLNNKGEKMYLPVDITIITLTDKLDENQYNLLEMGFKNE